MNFVRIKILKWFMKNLYFLLVLELTSRYFIRENLKENINSKANSLQTEIKVIIEKWFKFVNVFNLALGVHVLATMIWIEICSKCFVCLSVLTMAWSKFSTKSACVLRTSRRFWAISESQKAECILAYHKRSNAQKVEPQEVEPQKAESQKTESQKAELKF